MGDAEATGQQSPAEGEQPPDEEAPQPESHELDPDAPQKPGTGDVPPATKFQP